MTFTPFKDNAPGDFYVEDGCCTSCGMPTTVAPDLFEYAPDGHCFVSKQPKAADEIDRMVLAFQVQDVGCIRYKGSSKSIQIRLVDSGEGEQCDQLHSELKEKNSIVQAERAARYAVWKANQTAAQNAPAQKAEENSTIFRRFVRWLGMRGW